MNGTVVLLAAAVVLVLALVVWVLLRRRDGSEVGETSGYAAKGRLATTSTPAAAGAAPTGWMATGQPRDEQTPGGQAAAADATAARPDRAAQGPGAAREPGNPLEPSASDDDSVDVDEGEPQAEGAEFAGEGLSALEDGDYEDGGQVSGSAPQTPTEAFGEAEGSATQAPTEAEALGSVLDDPGSDSTPLFRSMREQLKASTSTEDDAPGVRRISELHEVVDGGFGIGSAAVIPGGVQPLGHPIKAQLSTKTYQDLHSPGYDQSEPDVWFLDAGFAERAGFRRAD